MSEKKNQRTLHVSFSLEDENGNEQQVSRRSLRVLSGIDVCPEMADVILSEILGVVEKTEGEIAESISEALK